MNAEQSVHALAQGGIISAGLIQIGGALAGGQPQRRAEKGHFAVRRRVHGLWNTLQYDESTPNTPRLVETGCSKVSFMAASPPDRVRPACAPIRRPGQDDWWLRKVESGTPEFPKKACGDRGCWP